MSAVSVPSVGREERTIESLVPLFARLMSKPRLASEPRFSATPPRATALLSKRFSAAPEATLIAETPDEVKPAFMRPRDTVTAPPLRLAVFVTVSVPCPVLVRLAATAEFRFGTVRTPVLETSSTVAPEAPGTRTWLAPRAAAPVPA